MTPIKFPTHNVIIAEHQKEYLPIPARANNTEEILTFCWKMTWSERFQVFITGKIWHSVYTGNRPLQPQILSSKDITREADINANRSSN